MVVMVVLVVMVVVVVGIIFINHALNLAKLLHVTRDYYGTLMIKSILFFCFLQELYEEGMFEICNRNYDPLSLLSRAHHDRQTPFWDIFQLLLLLMMMMMIMMMMVRHVQMKTEMMMLLSTSHLKNTQKQRSLQKLT